MTFQRWNSGMLRQWGALAIGVAMAMWAGCGGPSGPARYELRGTVTWGGKPVPSGQVVFEPDPDKGNTGPAAYARIIAGRYTTEPGKGAVAGPHVVRIIGTDGQPTAELPQGRMLFGEYRTSVEVPPQNATLDFEVPASSASTPR